MTINCTILIDSGATRSYASISLVKKHHIVTRTIQPMHATMADGSPLKQAVTTECTISLEFQQHLERELALLVADIADFDVILGMDWLRLHNPDIDWRTDTMAFNSAFCQSNCKGPQHSAPIVRSEEDDSDASEIGDDDILEHMTIHTRDEIIYSLRLTEQATSPSCAFITHDELLHTASTETLQLFRLDINQLPLNSLELLEDGMDVDETKEDLSLLPQEFCSFQDVFQKTNADKLPLHRAYDLGIDLLPGHQAPFMPMYPLSNSEHLELVAYIDENLQRGFIRPSKSPAGAPILFVKKKDGTLRMCVDYRGLNKVTVKNRYPLPLINDLLDKMQGSTFFSKIDLRGAYNLVRIREGDEWKTAFRTKRGLFEYLVMPFGLANAPAAFQAMMDDIFKDFLDVFAVVLLDDIGIFSTTREQHTTHITKILGLLRKHQLYAKLSKCEWFQSDIELLGHRVGIQGVSMCGDKVGAISNWPTPTCVKELQAFLGLANYYRRFIEFFSTTTLPLTNLLKKDQAWTWTHQHDRAVATLKSAFTAMPVLHYPNANKPYIIECDASDYALGAVLSQIGDDGKLHPIAFYSRKFTAPEINYEVHDKELMAVVSSLAIWRQYTLGASFPVTIFTDHRNLLHFTTNQQLTRRQARWSLFLAEYVFSLEYRKGSLQGKADALSRRVDYQIKEGDELYKHQFVTVLNPSLFSSIPNSSDIDFAPPVLGGRISVLQTRTDSASTLAQVLGIPEALLDDTLAIQMMKELSTNDPQNLNWSIEDGVLLFDNLVYVPESRRNQLLALYHDSTFAGHKGNKPTLELITRNYWFPKASTFIKSWVASCEQCLRSKTQRRKPYGLLHPLPIATLPWTSISMDFVVKLPISEGHDSVLVVVDRMTKMAHFIPCTESLDAPGLVNLVRRNIFRLHGLPTDIISDRGATFVSKFWRAFLDSNSISSNLSTAYHPQTDGQTERVNSTLKTYLRLFTNYNQDNWVDLLDQAEFCYNNTSHSSIHTTPFFANLGHHPRFIPTTLAPSRFDCPSALEGSERIKAIQSELQEHLTNAAADMKKYADRSRLDHVLFDIGDSVFISTTNTPSTRPSATLDYRHQGPYKIIERINPVAYRVELPPGNKRHDVFHVCMFTKAPSNPFVDRIIPRPLPVNVNTVEEFYVEVIQNVRLRYNKLEYLVKWVGYAPHENTWEPVNNVENCAAMETFLAIQKNTTKLNDLIDTQQRNSKNTRSRRL